MPTIRAEDGVRLHFATDGEKSAPALVFSNSLGTNLHMWDRQAEEAAKRGWFAIRYDQRGHGGSDAPDEAYTLDELGRDVVSLLDEIGVESAAFCGLSMGGATGLWLGVNEPSRFSKLALCNTGAKIGTDDLWNERIEAVRKNGMAALEDGIVQRWFTVETREDEERIEPVRRMLRQTKREGYAGCCAALRDADLRSAMASIAMPVLVVAGASDPATPPELGKAIADTVPEARYVEIEACAHLSNLERPERFDETLFEFLGDPR